MHEIPPAYVTHQTGSRIRLKLPEKRGDQSYLELLAERMQGISGVVSVETRPLTGSILIRHSSDTAHILRMVAADGGLRLSPPSSAGTNLQGRLYDTFDSISHMLKDVSGNELDLGGAAFLTLLGMGLYQIAKGNITAVPWYAAGWYALNILLKSNDLRSGR